MVSKCVQELRTWSVLCVCVYPPPPKKLTLFFFFLSAYPLFSLLTGNGVLAAYFSPPKISNSGAKWVAFSYLETGYSIISYKMLYKIALVIRIHGEQVGVVLCIVLMFFYFFNIHHYFSHNL